MTNYRKSKYWDINEILKCDAHYNLVIGERSNGKTYGTLKYALEQYFKGKGTFAIIRREYEDLKVAKAQQYFSSLVADGTIDKLSNGRYQGIRFKSMQWFFVSIYKNDAGEEELIQSDEPFAYGFPLTQMEHFKGNSYPTITTIIFDEFITRRIYLADEFTLFMNMLSTIIRDRNNVKIFMLANTVNKYCPYFANMGLKHIDKMNQGDIDIYTYGNTTLKVAVEYTAPSIKGKKSDTYFAFDNPRLNMITNGVWEIDIYPHLPYKYAPKDILFEFFIDFDSQLLHAEIINVGEDIFIYVHRKTTEIRNDNDIVFTTDFSPSPYRYRYITKPVDKKTKLIAHLFRLDKVFYQDNEIGEIVRNYLQWCGKIS